jgi:hypothetical protein
MVLRIAPRQGGQSGRHAWPKLGAGKVNVDTPTQTTVGCSTFPAIRFVLVKIQDDLILLRVFDVSLVQDCPNQPVIEDARNCSSKNIRVQWLHDRKTLAYGF